METIRLFIGWDHREAVGGHVFLSSLLRTTRYPVSLTIISPELAKELAPSDGTNAFSKARFLVPYLCGFKGHAIFLDGADMMLRNSLAELWSLRETGYAVQVVKHAYKTKHQKKYIGTRLEADNEDYPMKNWSSAILWDCGFFAHRKLTPEFIASQPGSYLHRFSWLQPDRIGDLPREWNHLVCEYEYDENAKLAHFTLGIPGFEHYKRADYAKEWMDDLKTCAQGLHYFGK